MPTALVVRLARAVPLPTAAANTVAPVELAASAKSPSTVPVNVIDSLPVDTVVVAASVVLPLTPKVAFVVM